MISICSTLFLSVSFVACDEESSESEDAVEKVVEMPTSYEFKRDGQRLESILVPLDRSTGPKTKSRMFVKMSGFVFFVKTQQN